VQAQDQVFVTQAEEAGDTSTQPPSVGAPEGSGSDVYGMYWSATELSILIADLATQQHLAHRHEAPTAVQLDAAWESEYVASPAAWRELSPATRVSAAEDDADRALVSGALSSKSQDALFYKDNKSQFWSRVCLTAVEVSVPGPHGSINRAASLKQADQVASQLSGHGRTAQRPVVSAGYCDSPEQFIEEPTTLQKQVDSMAPGQVAVLAESYGYNVVQLRSRTVIPYSPEIAGDIEVVATRGGSQTLPTGDQPVIKILLASHVEVNTLYGTWDPTVTSPCAPQVEPLANSPDCPE
jgi:hypothetical protein